MFEYGMYDGDFSFKTVNTTALDCFPFNCMYSSRWWSTHTRAVDALSSLSSRRTSSRWLSKQSKFKSHCSRQRTGYWFMRSSHNDRPWISKTPADLAMRLLLNRSPKKAITKESLRHLVKD